MHFGEDNVKASIQSMHLQDLKPGPRTRGLSLGSACARYRSWRIPPPTWLVPHEPSESMLQFPWHADYKCGRANKTVLAGKRSGTLELAPACSAPSESPADGQDRRFPAVVSEPGHYCCRRSRSARVLASANCSRGAVVGGRGSPRTMIAGIEQKPVTKNRASTPRNGFRC